MPGELNHWDMVDQNYPNYKKSDFCFYYYNRNWQFWNLNVLYGSTTGNELAYCICSNNHQILNKLHLS